MNDLVIIGAGAAGLFASVAASEAHLGCMTLERRHRPGLKLLMCGNNRCNISHAANASQMLAAYQEPVAGFLRKAITEFTPDMLRRWFARHGLQTAVHGVRIYPKSENADDVLHCFTDALREAEAPLALNCPVKSLKRLSSGGFMVCTENGMEIQARNVLLATGGVSYPKTGSVGDGHRIASELGLSVTELRPGLAGVEHQNRWLTTRQNCDIPDVKVSVVQKGKIIAETRGNVLCAGSVMRGSAIFDAIRVLSRRGISTGFSFLFDLAPDCTEQKLAAVGNLQGMLRKIELPQENAASLAEAITRNHVENIPELLKAIPVPVTSIRPLKEAIVTVGGVALDEINPETMEARRIPGLYFAGELMDVDGPTGGYNLHAAFATARLAIQSIGKGTGYANHHNS